jgi:hypothetical protein
MSKQDDRIEIENFTSPGHITRVDRAKYSDMRDALLKSLPEGPPGATVAQAKAALLPFLADDLFPGGEKAGWWLKAVQLDLEAKGIIKRGPNSPVRLFRVGG